MCEKSPAKACLLGGFFLCAMCFFDFIAQKYPVGSIHVFVKDGLVQPSPDCRKVGTLVDSMAIVNVFTPTQEECDKIQSGTVDTIPREVKLRILNEIPEIVRINVDMRQCVALLRGDHYVGSQQAKGQDFLFIIVQPATQLWGFGISNLLGQISEYLRRPANGWNGGPIGLGTIAIAWRDK